MLGHLDTFIAFGVVMLGVSLLLTTLTQLVSTTLGLRGTNLRWGVETLLQTVDPGLKDYARTLSDKILTNDKVSDSWLKLIDRWRLASTIRFEELVGVLRAIPSATEKLNSDEKVDKTIKDAVAAVVREYDEQASQDALAAIDVMRKVTPDLVEKVENAGLTFVSSAQASMAELNRKFDSIMDRSSQRFTAIMQMWTMGLALIVAFALHLDSFRLISQLYESAELRAELVMASEDLTNKADEVLGSSTSLAQIYADSMRHLKEQNSKTMGDLEVPAAFESKSAALDWLRENASDEELTAQYHQLVQEALKGNVNRLADQAGEIRAQLEASQFQLVPKPYPGWNYGFPLPNRHFWGTLFSALLLSLGAPFWFNTLKTLSGLRPILATREQKEREKKEEA